MAEVEAVPAASILLLRDDPLEVLMLRRPQSSSFMPNAWVFPGGAAEQLDEEIAREIGDGSLLTAMRYTAIRELFEETGIWLGPPLADAETKRRRLYSGTLSLRHLLAESPVDLDSLVWTSHWITPLGIPKRFDTYFFLAKTGRDVAASVDQAEAMEAIWVAPSDALSRADLQLVFPTIKNLEAIASFDNVDALLASRRGQEIPTTRPLLVMRDGQKKIVLP